MKNLLRYFSFSMLLFLAISCSNREQEHFSFIQICDPQLGMGGYAEDATALKQAVRQANALDVDFVVFCGDLVNHASDSSLADFKSITSELAVPFYYVPGNHDVGMVPTDTTLAFYRSTLGEDYFSIQHKGLAFIFTNSQLWKTDIGSESRKHDLWFNSTLKNPELSDRKVVIGHFPIYIDSLNEAENYSNMPPEIRTPLLENLYHNGVEAYLSGHRHTLLIHDYKGVQLVTGETTSKNFDERPRGFRKWEVSSDTLIHSFVPLKESSQTP